MVTYLITMFGLSIRKDCRSLNLSRTLYHCHPDTMRNEPVIVALQAVAEQYYDIVFLNSSWFYGGRDPRGITKGTTVFTVC